jgi:hypothetical protein
MISDREWLRKLGNWIDWEDESFGEKELRHYMELYDKKRLLTFYRAKKMEYLNATFYNV